MSTNDLIKKLTAEMEEKYGNGNSSSRETTYNDNYKQSVLNTPIKTFDLGYTGIFENVEDAIAAAKESQIQLMNLSMQKRKDIIASMRKASL